MMFDIKNATGKTLNTPLGALTIGPFLGKGKSGYSYRIDHGDQKYVLKLFHYEPCPYYHFGESNKVDLELSALERLKPTEIPLPRLIIASREENYLIKELIDGPTATELITQNRLTDHHINQLFQIFRKAQSTGLNIDYFPDNFVVEDEKLFYIDYEHNPYMPQWDLINWGLFYYANPAGLKQYQIDRNPLHINQRVDSGVPIKEPFLPVVNRWIELFG